MSNDLGRVAGFTLIEVIGALAVLAILASLLVPVVVRQIDNAAWNQEVTNLGAISNAIVLQVLRNKTIPSTNTWFSDAAKWLDMSPAGVASNPRGYARQYLVDTTGWLGNPAAYNPQSTNGTGAMVPSKARIILLSNIGSAVPAPPPSFDDLWNTPDRMVPGSWAGWNGKAEDLVVQRINLQPLFHHVILYNRDTNNFIAYFSIDTNGPAPVTPSQVDTYYLDGSVLGLYSNNATVLTSTELINRDLSRTYLDGLWTDDIGPGPVSAGSSNLQSTAFAFLLSPPRSQTRGVVDALSSFMNAYSSWAGTCFNNVPASPQNQILLSVMQCFISQDTNGNKGPCTLVQ